MPDREEMIRMARQHLDSLRAAGIEWLPAAEHHAASAPEHAAPASDLESEHAAPASDLLALASASSSPGLSLDQRRTELQLLSQVVAQCERCPALVASRTKTVFADGGPGVELCLIGEAPGADEDAQGKPFVGAAGQLLNKILAACGLKREEVYICNTLKCRPPGNRTPAVQEVANCHEYLDKQLELVGPRFICTLGGSAAQAVLGTTLSLGKLRGRFHDYRGIPVLCTYHPAYLLPHRSPEKKRDVWEDMKLLMARMGRPVK
jgi:DNA polymerase